MTAIPPGTSLGSATPGAPAPAPVQETEHEFSIVLRLQDQYAQVVDFGLGGEAPLVIDEPPPLGQGGGPNPARLLAAAVGSCLGASLLFCLRKAHVDVTDRSTTVAGTRARVMMPPSAPPAATPS